MTEFDFMQPIFVQRSKDISAMVLANGAVLAVGGMNYLRGTRQPFDLVVLVAQEHQRDGMGARKVIHLPLPDANLTAAQKRAVDRVASTVADALRHGKKVLITCAMGLNRSGMVAAMSLTKLGVSGEESIRIVRRLRSGGSVPALFNPFFTRMIRQSAG